MYVILIKIGVTESAYGPFDYDSAIAFGKDNSELVPRMIPLQTEI